MSTDAPTPYIEITRTVFPVVALHDEPGELARPDFFWTAFAVAPGVFMTAAHVVESASAHGKVALGKPTPDGKVLSGARVDAYDVWSERDVALLFKEAPRVTILNTWLTHGAHPLADLVSFGYPHAVTRWNEADDFNVVFRAYKGHVITIRGFDRLE